MAKLDQRFLDVVLRDMPYDEENTLETVLTGIAGGGAASYGCWLSYASWRSVIVNSGVLDVFGTVHQVPDTIVDIYDDFGDAGSPLINTVYYAYAADEDGVLRFYISAATPTRPGHSDTALSTLLRGMPLCHPAYANWRYIGQVLFRAGATILPFTICTPTYWEGMWTSATRNTTATLEHGWGSVPQDVDFMFSTTATNSDNVLTTFSYADPSTKLYGLKLGTVTNKAIAVSYQKDGLFWNNNTAAWINSGYVKVVVRR